MQNTVSLHITAQGGLGDGIAEHQGKRIYVPYTTAGDIITATIGDKMADGFRGHLVSVEVQAPERITPPCPYFTRCGGCELQHLSDESYTEFKLTRAKQALVEAGYNPKQLSVLHRIPVASRRRAEFKVSGDEMGFFRSETNDVIAIESCLILSPALDALVQPLKAFVKNQACSIRTVSVTEADNTIDMFVKLFVPLDSAGKAALIAFAKSHDIGRLAVSVHNTITELHLSAAPLVHNGTTEVELPHNAFLQASRESQQILTDWVVKQVGKKKRVLDIFSGIGTYSFPLAEKGVSVTAYEGSEDMVAALLHAAKKSGLKLRAQVLDLVKNPIDIDTLGSANSAVINPPRPGAAAQIRTIAASPLKELVMVSCNPASFARDAKMLHQAGFKIANVEALDQFTYSAHLEIMAKFVR